MIEIVSGSQSELRNWIMERTYHPPVFGDYACLGFVDRGKLIGGVLFCHHDPGCSIEMHGAGDFTRVWLNRKCVEFVAAFPFERLKVRRVVAPVWEMNWRSIRFLEHAGFQHEGTLRQAARNGDDLLIYGLLRNECKFLR